MYIPNINLVTDQEEILSFIKQYSFGTIITAKQGIPLASHLPFTIATKNDRIILTGHFAKANKHWMDIEENPVMVIFTEPHAYISPVHYDSKMSVPTWNYIAVHAYGIGTILTTTAATFTALEDMIQTYEAGYKDRWDSLPEAFKLKMLNGIVAFEIEVTDLQAKNKLSQNKTTAEQERIVAALSQSNSGVERSIAGYMQQNLNSSKTE